MKSLTRQLLAASLLSVCLISSAIEAHGDMRLRHDLELLDDAGVIHLPLTRWPLSWGDISHAALDPVLNPLSPDFAAVLQNRTHFEGSDTVCYEGGLGLSGIVPDCAYEHHIYQSGYRFHYKVVGHGMDGDGLSYSLGSTLVQSAGHGWNNLLRYMEINTEGAPSARHSIPATPQERTGIQVTDSRDTALGRFDFAPGYSQPDDAATDSSTDEVTALLQWRTQ